MVHQDKINTWKKEHYIAYLYLASADSDSETTQEELSMASRKFSRLLKEYFESENIAADAVFNDVFGEIMEHTEPEKTDLINALNKRFHLEDDVKTDIISDLTDIISADDQVQASEHYMVSFVRVVLSKN